MDPNAIALAGVLADKPAPEREQYYLHAGVPAALRAGVEALLADARVEPETTADSTTRTVDLSEAPTVRRTFIGRYEVIRLLGQGGMGQVFLAHDPVLDRKVAVKLIGGEVDDSDARRRLVQEARAAGRLRHPNIVTIFDAGEHAGNPYIAMEHVGGETLRSLIRRRASLSLPRRLELMEAACAGLAHAHRENVVHFDVKPDNLMLDTSGVLKVLDFGIARVFKSDVLMTRQLDGTLRYMSPEQVGGGPLDRRSDVFSLGCSLFELVAYEPAYRGSPHELITRIVTGPVPRLVDTLPSVDPRLDALVSRAMALEPAQRFDDIDELGASLGRLREEFDPAGARVGSVRQVAVSVPSQPFPVAAAPSPPASGSRRRVALVGIAAAALLAIGLPAVWILTNGSTPNGGMPFTEAPTGLPATLTPAGPAVDPQQSTAAPDQTTARRPPPAPTSPAPSARPTGPAPSADPAPFSARGQAMDQLPTVAAPGRNAETGAIRITPPPAALATPNPAGSMANGPVDTATASPAAPETKPQSSPEDEVLAVLRRWEAAHETLDVSAVLETYPTVAAAGLRQAFAASRAYKVELLLRRVTVKGDNATVHARVVRRVLPRRGSETVVEAETEFRLERGARGWLIVENMVVKP